MIDNLALAISHGLIALLAFRLLFRRDLDQEPLDGEDVQDDKPSWLKRDA